MSNSEYIGRWRFINNNILQIFNEGNSLKWRWLLWKGEIINITNRPEMSGNCLKWRPTKKDGYSKILSFNDYLKTL